MSTSLNLNALFHDQWAQTMGVIDWACTDQPLPTSYQQFQTTIAQDFAGPLRYLTDHRAKMRADLRDFFPLFQSAIVFLFDYRTEKKRWQNFYLQDVSSNQLKIASYALAYGGQDYHSILTSRLQEICQLLKTHFPTLKTQISLDVHPVLERDLAFRAGLGWFGKNTMIINRAYGSFFLIGSVLCSENFSSNSSRSFETNHCSSCQRCVDFCPTGALSDRHPYQLDARKCLASLTIEPSSLGKVPPGTKEIFGCDICQDVCPWNQKALAASSAANASLRDEQQQLQEFFLQRPREEIIDDLEKMSNRQYQRKFQSTTLVRPGRAKMRDNLLAGYLPSSSTQTC